MNGLSRQASSTTSFSFRAPCSAAITWSMGTASERTSRSAASLASTGMRKFWPPTSMPWPA
jgi:hypothetical protein